MKRVILAAALVCATGGWALAQETTTSTETKTFDIIAVDGNQLIVALPEGTRELTVADDFRFTVDGQPLSVHELKAGMKGTATITTRTTVTPVTVTEVKNGTVIERTNSTLVIRSGDEVKKFSQADLDKREMKIMRDGRPARVSDFREGDQLTATIITTREPQILTEREVQASLTPEPIATTGLAEAEAPPATLPQTATAWPLLGMTSVLTLAFGAALTARRRRVR